MASGKEGSQNQEIAYLLKGGRMAGNRKAKAVPYKDEGPIIVISSVVSTFTYIVISSMLTHLLHPAIVIALAIVLVSIFLFVLLFFRRGMKPKRLNKT